jgi:thiamine biosynthesis lipoprotein
MMEYREFRAMNSDIVLAAEGAKGQIEIGFRETHSYIEAAEKRFTRFSEESELAELNRKSGQWYNASPGLFQVVQRAKVLYEQTHGLFDPGILDALVQAGYNRSMDELHKFGPQAGEITDKPVNADFNAIVLNETENRILLPEGTRIDLGGIAKGWIAEQAARRLAQYSTACAVSAGGDLALIGLPEGSHAWQIGLEDPLDPSRDLALLQVGPGAVATSSIAKRRWLLEDKVQHHLIDPRTGQPARTDWLSVTVICPDAAVAEVYAKALLIAGPEEAGLLDIDSHNIIFLAVDKYGKLWGSKRSSEVLDVEFEPA